MKKLLLTLTLLTAFNSQAHTSLDIGVGKQGDSSSMSVGATYKDYVSDKVFISYSVDLKRLDASVDMADKITDTGYIRYNESHKRKDLTVKIGLGYSFDKIDVSTYYGFGQSKYSYEGGSIEAIHIKDGYKAGARIDNGSHSKTELKKEVGFKLQYNFNDRIGVFTDFSNTSYANSQSNTSAIVGISVNF